MRKWKHLKYQAEKLRIQTAQAERELRDYEVAYLRRHPLDDVIKHRLVALLRSGKPICHADGLDNLRELDLDPLWAEVLNAWGYEHSGCRYDDPKEYALDADKLREALNGGTFDPVAEWSQE